MTKDEKIEMLEKRIEELELEINAARMNPSDYNRGELVKITGAADWTELEMLFSLSSLEEIEEDLEFMLPEGDNFRAAAFRVYNEMRISGFPKM